MDGIVLSSTQKEIDMKAPKRIDAGTEPTTQDQKAWEWYAAKEIREGGTKSMAEIVGVIRKYSTPMIKFMADVPVKMTLRTKIPGSPHFQDICSNIIKVGQERGLAVRKLDSPMLFESFLFEGRRAWPVGYKEGFDDHEYEESPIILP